ncbi:hypothetical protein BST20_17840 [Mycobacterium branderi]|uniref:Uncharacterized protein n=3 Tax=Mycobacterium branderi TaxID=43348 RepID=A0AA91LVF6_9MYCO|nr:hypothetical protein BST20_17840 [Mycobacterium branderi]
MSVAMLVGCGGTVAGQALMAPASDDANVALMDTGVYPTAAGHPIGTAGDDQVMQGILEAHRLADFVVGPWQVKDFLKRRPNLDSAIRTGPIATAADVHETLDRPFSDIAASHGFIAGFSSMRVASPAGGAEQGLTNAVLRFPDAASAAAAGAEMAASNPTVPGDSPHEPTTIRGYQEAIATRYTRGGIPIVESFTPYGPYVLYQSAYSTADRRADTAQSFVVASLTLQKPLIDQFIPTDPARLGSLPKDPSGRILAATLAGEGAPIPSLNAGVWRPAGWLHFEADPLQAAAALRTAGVDYVSQRSATVYQTRNAEAAERVVNHIGTELTHVAGVEPLNDHVPGLPEAQCYQRIAGALPPTAPGSWLWIQWHFKCVARADRYAYTVFSDTEKDAMQQTSAQYRMLAGK